MIDPGRVAYEAYCKHSDNKSLVSGVELPNWEETSQPIQDAWRAAATAVMNYRQAAEKLMGLDKSLG